MARDLGVGGGMVILRLVAATDMAAGHTGPQVHPGVSPFEAFLAARGRGLNVLDLIQVCAGSRHRGVVKQKPAGGLLINFTGLKDTGG